jgi:hypothetical protein
VATGNELYAAARAKALGRQAPARPAPDILAMPDPDRPCTCTGGDPLPHLGMYHHLLSVVYRGPQSWCCSIATGPGRCPCNAYTPAPDPGPTKGEHMPDNQPRYVVSRSDGKPIPDGEPCFVIRGQDVFAVRAVQAYIDLTRDVVSPEVTSELLAHRERLREWHATQPVKIPD